MRARPPRGARVGDKVVAVVAAAAAAAAAADDAGRQTVGDANGEDGTVGAGA